MEINKQKESLELKKLYLTQTENFENKIFFSMMALSFSILLLSLESQISAYFSYLGIILILLVSILFLSFQKKRKRKFNEVIKELNNKKLTKDIK